MKYLSTSLIAVCFIAALSLSCQKVEGGDDKTEIPSESADTLGTYRFADTTYFILTGRYAESEEEYNFLFSPDLPSGQIRSYVAFSIKKEFTGREIDVTTIWHNDDYSLIYEDPWSYYSPLYPLKGGSLTVKHNDNNDFTVKADLVLPDDTPLSIDFTGELTPISE